MINIWEEIMMPADKTLLMKAPIPPPPNDRSAIRAKRDNMQPRDDAHPKDNATPSDDVPPRDDASLRDDAP